MVINYAKLGLKAGLEIHQQLDTNKLFCNCPSILRSDDSSYTIERILNPVVGETGKVDTAAAFEKLKEKIFTYHVYDTNCLVELDEEPPHNINPESLKIAMQIAILLNCKIFPVSQIMRKTVIDGSNTSGFQRTVLIAYDGHIETSEGKVRIETIALEEDSARKISDEHGKREYSLDRLGIPLVEITTSPDLKSPEQIKEAALKIGEILRACQVKRGIGTIRQDVNVSIAEGNRVEIKGFQNPKMMIATVDNEIKRQEKLAQLKASFKKASPEEIKDLTSIFENTNVLLISKGLKKENFVLGWAVKNAAGLIGEELQPQKRVGTDLSEYAKPVSGIGGIIHSDESLQEKYGFTKDEIESTKKELNLKKNDAFIMVVASKDAGARAYDAIKQRISLLQNGNPKEVRKALSDGTTKFLRPMPGAARMYPETDCELLRIKKQAIDEVKNNLPKLASEHKKYLAQFGLNNELIKVLLKEGLIDEFREITSVTDHYDTVAKAITLFKKEIMKKENLSKTEYGEIVNQDILIEVFEKVGKDISPNDVKQILHKLAQGKTVEQALEKKEIHLSEEVKKLIKEKPNLTQGAYMGLIMAKFKGHVNGKEVADELQKQIN